MAMGRGGWVKARKLTEHLWRVPKPFPEGDTGPLPGVRALKAILLRAVRPSRRLQHFTF